GGGITGDKTAHVNWAAGAGEAGRNPRSSTVHERGDLLNSVIGIFGEGCKFVAQTQIQRQPGPYPPIILDVSGKQTLPDRNLMRSSRRQRVELVRSTAQKVGRRVGIHPTVGAELFQYVVAHSFEGEPELDRVGASGDEGVVIELAGRPAMLKAVQAAQSDSGRKLGTGNWVVDGDLRGRFSARGDRESGIDGCAASRHRSVNVASNAVDAGAECINHRRTEDVRFFDARHLPPGKNFVGGISERGLLGLGSGIP